MANANRDLNAKEFIIAVFNVIMTRPRKSLAEVHEITDATWCNMYLCYLLKQIFVLQTMTLKIAKYLLCVD